MTGKADVPVDTSRQSWRTLYFVAGVSAIVFVVALIAALVVDFVAPPPVHGGAATLEFIAANRELYGLEQVLWILPNALAVLVFVALAVALAPVNQSLALIGGVIGGIPWALFLAIPVTSRGSLSLLYLSDRYVEASVDDRARFATAAEAIIAENNTPAIVGVLSAAGILLMSIVMTKGVFSRVLAWLGVLTGALGIISEALRHVVPSFYWGYGVLLWVWVIAAGIALIRLGQRTPVSGSVERATPAP